MKVLFDGNNLFLRTFFLNTIGAGTPDPGYSFWRFLTFNSIYSFLKTKAKNPDEVILAFDSSPSWRKIFHPGYKSHRKDARTNVDWKRYNFEAAAFRKSIASMLPIKVLKVEKCEADDIIAILTRYFEDDVTIVSADEDFVQLVENNIKLYHPFRKEFVNEENVELFKTIKALIGRKKDFIPNVKTPLKIEVGEKWATMGEKTAEKIINKNLETWLEKEGLKERYRQNRILTDFAKIPPSIEKLIIKSYQSYQIPQEYDIKGFITKYEWKSFLKRLDDIEEVLEKLK